MTYFESFIFQIEKETFEDIWEVFAIALAFLSLASLLIVPILFIRMAFKYVEEVK